MAQYKTVRALSRGLQVLQALNDVRAASVADLSRRTGLARSTVHRSIETLLADGYVYEVCDSEYYSLSDSAQRLSSRCSDVERLIERAGEYVTMLGRQVQWPIDFFVPESQSLLLRLSTHHQSRLTFFPTTKVGRAVPLLPTAPGRAYLASLNADECSALIESAAPPGDVSSAAQLLRDVKRRGYGFRRNGLIAGTSSISVALRLRGRPVACLSMMFFTSTMSIEDAANRFLGQLRQTARDIENALHTDAAGDDIPRARPERHAAGADGFAASRPGIT
jgi:IclR family mhp operon transcriptional activator